MMESRDCDVDNIVVTVVEILTTPNVTNKQKNATNTSTNRRQGADKGTL